MNFITDLSHVMHELLECLICEKVARVYLITPIMRSGASLFSWFWMVVFTQFVDFISGWLNHPSHVTVLYLCHLVLNSTM